MTDLNPLEVMRALGRIEENQRHQSESLKRIEDAANERLNHHSARITSLEHSRARMYGISAGVSAVVALLAKFWPGAP